MNIGWPEGIWIGLALLSLIITADQHGKSREPYNFHVAMIAQVIMFLLLWWGGFFD